LSHEAYLLFPVHLDGTLLDNANIMLSRKEFYSTADVLQIFRQVSPLIRLVHYIQINDVSITIFDIAFMELQSQLVETNVQYEIGYHVSPS
jgi:hypothetical protein